MCFCVPFTRDLTPAFDTCIMIKVKLGRFGTLILLWLSGSICTFPKASARWIISETQWTQHNTAPLLLFRSIRKIATNGKIEITVSTQWKILKRKNNTVVRFNETVSNKLNWASFQIINGFFFGEYKAVPLKYKSELMNGVFVRKASGN